MFSIKDQFDDEFSPDFFDMMEFMVGGGAGMHFNENFGHHTHAASHGRHHQSHTNHTRTAASQDIPEQPQPRRWNARNKPSSKARQRKKRFVPLMWLI